MLHSEAWCNIEFPYEPHNYDGQQHKVDGEIGQLGGDARAPVEDGRDTGDAARGDVVGQQENNPPNAVGQHRNGYHRVVLQFTCDRILRGSVHIIYV